MKHAPLASQATTSRRHVLIEYVLIAGVNDSVHNATELVRLLSGMEVLLNVIPYNPTDVCYEYAAPTAEALKLFVDTVKAGGLHATVRQELGQDIASACGQLVIGAGKPPGADGFGGCDSQQSPKRAPVIIRDLEDLVASAHVKHDRAASPRRPRRPEESVFQTAADMSTPSTLFTDAAIPLAVGAAAAVVAAGAVFVGWRLWATTRP
ncbi:sorting nexin [Cladochytrium tenue]|nr:sorting nexin [Cladochytrium tenue]